jgi:hypothetical protein
MCIFDLTKEEMLRPQKKKLSNTARQPRSERQ